MIYMQKVWFYTYVLATTANLREFRRRRRLENVLTMLRMPRSFAGKHFNSAGVVVPFRRRYLRSLTAVC